MQSIDPFSQQYPVAHTLPSGKKVHKDQQSQSIAYSLDNGMTWTPYDAVNPIIHYPPSSYRSQYKNFRDPFVFWHEQTQRWIMVTTLAELHKLVLYTSRNLKDWAVLSEFGPYNAVGGVWECPNLFPLPVEGTKDMTKWVMAVGLNPGGPPGTVGSGSQYFIGNFNGSAFIPDPDTIYPGNKTANWLDWGPDYYAAAPFNGLAKEDHVQLAWMSNWQYGEHIPTHPWRSAMSLPRHLSLKNTGGKTTLVQAPHVDWKSIKGEHTYTRAFPSFGEGTEHLGPLGKTLAIELSFSAPTGTAASQASQFGIIVQATEDMTQQTRIGYDFPSRQVFLDRTRSGIDGFDATFPRVYNTTLAPCEDGEIHLGLLVDWSSVEVFGGEGETTLTAQIFPREDARHVELFSTDGSTEDVKVEIWDVSSIWN